MNKWFWRCVVIGNWVVLALWCSYWLPRSVVVALAGAALLICGAGLQLAAQMLMMRSVLRRRNLPMPAAALALRAWVAEWRLSVQIFGWQIPFQERAEPDGLDVGKLGAQSTDQVGVVLVHGYFCNRAVWNSWLRSLRAQGIPCAAMTLEPAHGHPVDAMVKDLDGCVKTMVGLTGRAPLLVAHSMGGLVVRAWLKTLTVQERAQYVGHVVTVATPHHGTWLAWFAHRLPAVDMREHSGWIEALGEPPADVRFTCWASRSDNIVFPSNLAVLAGHASHVVDDAAHMQLLFDERVWQDCLQTRAHLQARVQAAVCGGEAGSAEGTGAGTGLS